MQAREFELIMKGIPRQSRVNKGEIIYDMKKVGELVRCEDCKHYRSFNTTERKYSKCDGLCRRHLGLPKDENGFCSDGEWKEE